MSLMVELVKITVVWLSRGVQQSSSEIASSSPWLRLTLANQSGTIRAVPLDQRQLPALVTSFPPPDPIPRALPSPGGRRFNERVDGEGKLRPGERETSCLASCCGQCW
ncbi:hypothetical protein PoB_003815100 [Plakobranchus ocellatus]|uniref:Secreted protein n=1 Tax=Plakobranchus ocellatus TaxID=259542 RepID=A0AAV4AU52_9GAST|nr:hypothetical protein PoB_003815100 [Plakobranchus ocellatus]